MKKDIFIKITSSVLSVIKKVISVSLEYENLKRNGLRSKMMGPIKLDNNPILKEYIENTLKMFNKPDTIYKILNKQNIMSTANYLSLSLYAIENIDKLSNINQVKDCFGNELQDITEQKHSELKSLDLLFYMQSTSQFIGQKNYFFKFKDEEFNGEISLDFLPSNMENYMKNTLIKERPELIKNRLVNFRCQLFFNDLSDNNKFKEKHKQLLNNITGLYGQGNNTEDELKLASDYKKVFGADILCWIFSRDEKFYHIAFYFSSKDSTPYSSFSVQEMLEVTN